MDDQLTLAVRTLRQLRDTLATISQYARDLPPQAVSSIAGLAVTAADKTLAEIGEMP